MIQRYNIIVCLIILMDLIVIHVNAIDDEEEFPYATVLDHENHVQLRWRVEGDNASNSHAQIVFNLRVFTPQLVNIIGFGMSDHGECENADFVLFEIERRNGQVTLADCHTDAFGVLHADNHENYKLIDYTATKEKQLYRIDIEFKRRLDTCDREDYLIETGTVHLLHFLITASARSQSLSISNLLNAFKPANRTEMKQAQLVRSTHFQKSADEFDAKEDKSYFDVLNENVRLSSDDTTYWCRVYKLDTRFHDKKHHIVAFESRITEQNSGIVHHMELFHCIEDPDESMKRYNGACTSEAKPVGLTQCRKVIAAWAMGAGRFVYPANVGGVLGGTDYGQYLVLEVHYDNQKRRTDIIDSSGLRIFYERALRKYDAGIMEIGLEYNAKNSIPPQQAEFHMRGHCPSECTRAALPSPHGITVFASQLHTHLTGRRAWTSLVRDGRVVETLNSDNHYDQMFQEIRLLRRPVRVLPGDSLVHTCVYDTRTRTNVTFGGYSIRDEMCVNYMHYYPLSDLELCKSSIADPVLDEFFSRMRHYDLAPTDFSFSLRENFNAIRWTPLTATVLSKLYDLSPIALSCNSSSGQQINAAYKHRHNKVSMYFEALGRTKDYFRVSEVSGLTSNFAPIDPDIAEECPNSQRQISSEEYIDE